MRPTIRRAKLVALALLGASIVPNSGCKLLQTLIGLIGGGGGGIGGGGLPPIGGGGLPPIGGGGLPPIGGGGTIPGGGAPGAPTPGGGSATPPALGGPGESDIRPPGNLAADDYDYLKDIQWTQTREFPWNGNHGGSRYAVDVMSHTMDRFTAQHGLSTMVHETAHGIHAELRRFSGRHNAVYVEGGKGAVMAEPRVRKSAAMQFLPPAARSWSRYGTYVSGQQAWDDQPLYLWDEWGAYICGGRAGVEQAEAGGYRESGQDMVDGQLEFLTYCTAITRAIAQGDPQYFNYASPSGKQLKAVFACEAERTIKWGHRGLKIPAFSGFSGARFFGEFQQGQGSAAGRDFLKQWLGAGFTRRVFGF